MTNTTNKKTLAKVKELYNKVQIKKKAIASAEKNSYITSGEFRYGNNSAVIDIKTLRHKNGLTDILAFLLEKQSFRNEANNILGIEEEKFTWQGASVEEWTNDILIRKTQLSIIHEKAELEKAEAILLQMDPSIVEAIRLEEISKLVG